MIRILSYFKNEKSKRSETKDIQVYEWLRATFRWTLNKFFNAATKASETVEAAWNEIFLWRRQQSLANAIN